MRLAVPTAFTPLASATTLPAPEEDPALLAPRAREYLARVRADARARQDAGEGGIALVQAWTDAVDRLIRWLHASATLAFEDKHIHINYRCTVIAQGGYGRGELNPYSDIDLLFLYPWKITPYVETVVDAVLLPLFDGGLEVGWATRNVRECARMAARDLKSKTALLDVRYLCGDEPLFEELHARIQAETWSDHPSRFFKEKLAFAADRHARFGDSIFLLQPNLKEGQGGLRDLHTALWMAKVKFKVDSFRELIPLGVLVERDLDDLQAAMDFLWRLRNAMHFAANAHMDHLTYELQYKVAPALGFGGDKPGVEALMRAYYRHAQTVARITDAVVARCVEPPAPGRGSTRRARVIAPGLRILGRTLSVTDRAVLEREPANVVRVFGEAQRHGATLASATQDLIRAHVALLARHHAAPAVADAFLDVLRARGHVYETVAEMHRLGVLKAVLPEFANLECLISHDPFHVYTVDYHSLMGLRELDRLRAGEVAELVPHVTQVSKEVPQPELLFMGMLLHDVGKGQGHDHDTRGAEIAGTVCRRLGLNVDEQAAVRFLVQHHLLMSHLAQHRDLGDDDLVIDFCRTVGTVENLQRLYCLTFADMRAVGPGIWNNWRGQLVTELYRRARGFFDTDTFEAEDRGARVARVRARVLEEASSTERLAAEAFVRTMPDSYFLATPEDRIADDVEVHERFHRDEALDGSRPALALQVTHHPDRGFSELVVCCRDRPGLFASLSGVLAARGMNILGARIATSHDGIALDAFRISHEGLPAPEDPEAWAEVDQTIRRVLAGQVDVESLVLRRRGTGWLRRQRRPIATVVTVDNDVSHDYTVIDVQAADRVGLLFTITNCLFHCWLQIHVAKITTMVDQVLDVFYVTDHTGRKIEDPARLEEIRRAIEDAVREDGGAPAVATAAQG